MRNHWTEIEKYLEDQKIAQELIGELRDFHMRYEVENQVSNLRICGRIKRISPAEELLLQLLVILDNAVMHSCHISVITDMRMGIDL